MSKYVVRCWLPSLDVEVEAEDEDAAIDTATSHWLAEDTLFAAATWEVREVANV